jgi:hypothetical protein
VNIGQLTPHHQSATHACWPCGGSLLAILPTTQHSHYIANQMSLLHYIHDNTIKVNAEYSICQLLLLYFVASEINTC